MIAPADFPPHPTKGRIMLDGYHNCLMWEGSRDVLTEEERLQADYRKSIASYAAPWNPQIGRKWLDATTNRIMIHQWRPVWVFEDDYSLSAIPVETIYTWPAEIPPMTRKPAEKVVAEPDPPKKSRVFTLE